MPARGWHHDLHVQHHPRDIRSNGGPAPMLIAKAQEMVRILGEVSDALESSASGLRYLAHGGTSAPTATQAETTTATSEIVRVPAHKCPQDRGSTPTTLGASTIKSGRSYRAGAWAARLGGPVPTASRR